MNARTGRVIVVYCGVLLSIAAFSVDITLPFFASMSFELNAELSKLALTVSVFIGSLGVGQLIFGPISDRFGRKPALASGLVIFLLGSLLAMQSDSLRTLLLARVVQGIGAGAAPAVARAVMRDLFSGRELARNLAVASAVFSIGPIIGPLLGVALVAAGGSWRFVFVGMATYVVILLLILVWLPETLAARQSDALNPGRLLINTRTVFGHPQARYFITINAIMLSTMLLILSVLPVIYAREFGISGAGFAYFFAVHGLGIIVGQTINHRLIAHSGNVAGHGTGGLADCFWSSVGIVIVSALQLLNPYAYSALVTLFCDWFSLRNIKYGGIGDGAHGPHSRFSHPRYKGHLRNSWAVCSRPLVPSGWMAETLPFAVVLAGICVSVLILLLRYKRAS